MNDLNAKSVKSLKSLVASVLALALSACADVGFQSTGEADASSVKEEIETPDMSASRPISPYGGRSCTTTEEWATNKNFSAFVHFHVLEDMSVAIVTLHTVLKSNSGRILESVKSDFRDSAIKITKGDAREGYTTDGAINRLSSLRFQIVGHGAVGAFPKPYNAKIHIYNSASDNSHIFSGYLICN